MPTVVLTEPVPPMPGPLLFQQLAPDPLVVQPEPGAVAPDPTGSAPPPEQTTPDPVGEPNRAARLRPAPGLDPMLLIVAGSGGLLLSTVGVAFVWHRRRGF
jgi:hypothetical protein